VSAKSEAAELLLYHLRIAGVPAPTLEYQFHENRKWQIDMLWLDDSLAVEIDGGNHMAAINKRTGKAFAVGRHTMSADYEKLNEIVLHDMRLLRFTPEMVKSGMALSMIERALNLVPEVDDQIPF
jgi:hypothetical protein